MSSKAVRPRQARAGRHGAGGPRPAGGWARPWSAWAASRASGPGCCSTQSGRHTWTGSAGAA
eukprot:4361308-Alexandrium_andersonii.AAC.1